MSDSTPDNWFCNGNTHTLWCYHVVILDTIARSASCLRPQFGTQAGFSHDCPTCITLFDEAHVLQVIGNLRELRLMAEAMQADDDHPAQSEEIELMEEYISEREINLEHEVSDEVWRLYVHEGEEGIRRRQGQRRLEQNGDA